MRLHFFFILYSDQQMHNYFNKPSHSHMFRHYRVILRELVFNTWPCYTSITKAAVGNICVTYQGIDYKLPEDDTIVSKHVGV